MTNETTADTTASGAGEPVAVVERGGSAPPFVRFLPGHSVIYDHEGEHLYSQATIDTLRAQLEAAERCKVAFEEWLAKSEWVQATARPHELGKHRADVLRERIEAAEARAEAAEADATRYRWLRENEPEQSYVFFYNTHEELDAAIDAAKAATP